MDGPERVLHVERTAEPRVLRWVCHRPDLDQTPVPPRGSRLASLVDDGTVEFIVVTHGDLIVAFPSTADLTDGASVASVHRAVAESLTMPGWAPRSDESSVALRRRATRDGC